MGGVYSTLSSYFDPADPPRAHRAESSVSLPGRRINTGGETCNFHESVKPPSADTPKKPKKAVEIESVDLCIDENSRDHHTADYEVCQDGYIDDLTKEVKKAQLVIRRGQTFKVKITLNDKCSEDTQFRVISTIGKIPLSSKGNYNEIITERKSKETNWSVKLDSKEGKTVELLIYSPPKCAVGKWNLKFDAVYIDDDGEVVSLSTDKTVAAQAYILFNAWCKDDAVYMKDETWRKEYVLNDTGKIYTGNYKQIYGRPWNFGQFESISLETALYVLNELTKIPITFRGSPTLISRKMSALVNSSDDNGILTGRWDGEYSDGVSPTKWTGSVAILQKYMETKQPVEYGQCWVFSGVMTTVCRALGIPTRSVTNFASAHDTDGSLTIDMHWDENEEHMPELDTDSVWNFHVWNECWMTRPDLQEGYGGWQAVDATPQETSDGIYCAGPASLVAIKNGNVGVTFDTPFIFAEVNADKVHWVKQKDGSVEKLFERRVVGKKISTKRAGSSRDFSVDMWNPDREDITDQYKYPEGTSEERAAVWRANEMSTKPTAYKEDDSQKDVTFKVEEVDNVFLGSSFEIRVIIRNMSDEKRSVGLTVTLCSVYYTGINKTKLKRERFAKELKPKSEEVVTMKVEVDDYLADMKDHTYAMKINYLGSVKETKQIFASQDDFRLRTLVPDVIPSKKSVAVGESFKVKASFKNPLDISLQNCEFTFEAAGNLKPVTISKGTISAGEVVEAEVEVTAKRAGYCVVISSFECKEMGDIQGQCTVEVKRK